MLGDVQEMFGWSAIRINKSGVHPLADAHGDHHCTPSTRCMSTTVSTRVELAHWLMHTVAATAHLLSHQVHEHNRVSEIAADP
jgi:hypothetical protein